MDGADELDALNAEVVRLHQAGAYAQAAALAQRALALAERLHGPDHPSVGTTLNNLAELYRAQGRYSDAEPLYKRCITIVEKALGPDHPDVGTTLNNLAALYEALGRGPEAAVLAKRALKIPGWRTAHIPVLFATNRSRTGATAQPAFGNDQKIDLAQMSIGVATILAPETEVRNRANRGAEALGQLHNAGGRQTAEALLSVKEIELATSGEDLVAAVRARLTRAARFPGQAFIYVHGYNNSFDEAVKRTAKIAFDLEFDGLIMAFAWPSKRGFLGYGGDRERARIAAPFLLEALELIGRELPEVTVHLIAHSTGGEVVLTALERLSDRSAGGPRLRLGQLILAHADVNRLRFRQSVPSLLKLGLGVTSYSSSEDWAMWLSHLARGERARLGGRPIHAEGVDSIDVTGLGTGPISLNHNVFVTNTLVFNDMLRLMKTGARPPGQRTPHFQPVKTDRGTHWEHRRAGT